MDNPISSFLKKRKAKREERAKQRKLREDDETAEKQFENSCRDISFIFRDFEHARCIEKPLSRGSNASSESFQIWTDRHNPKQASIYFYGVDQNKGQEMLNRARQMASRDKFDQEVFLMKLTHGL